MRRAICGALLIGICSAVVAQPIIRIEAQGAVWDGIYTSPDRSFQVRLPGLLMPGTVITDEARPGGEVTATFADDLCRQYRVHRAGPAHPSDWIGRIVS